MRLSAKPIINFCDVNNYTFGNQWIIRAGDPNTLYFQVVDLDQVNSGTRHLLGIGVANQPYGIIVQFLSIDNTKTIEVQAVQVDANDSSIWKVSLASTQTPSGGNVQFAVQEGSAIRRFSALNILGVEFPTDNGSC